MMKKILLTLSALTILSLPSLVHANGIAICIAQHKNSNNVSSDVEYFLRYGGNSQTTGYIASKAARADFNKKYRTTPACRSSGQKFMSGGHFVIITGGRKKDYSGTPYNRWALGFGDSPSAALIDAKAELSRRDWSWSNDKHGYTIEEKGQF